MTRQKEMIQRTFVKALVLLVAPFFLAACQSAGKVNPPVNPQGPPNRVYVIGHRGAAGLAPENTLAAFRKALEIGVDAVELDVLLTADGALVVHHDFWLKPEITRIPKGTWLQGKSGPVIKNLTLAELKTYDVGRLQPHTLYASRYPDQQPADGERIPTLREVISLMKSGNDAKTQLWIEIKTSPESPEMTPSPEVVADAVLKTLKEEDVSSRTSILSFDWRSLVHVQKVAPQIPTVYVSLVSNNLDNIKPGKPGPSPWTAGIDVDDFDGSIPRAVKAARSEERRVGKECDR
jgi:glycerophosphoryl diester phosphodiesterase